MKFKITYIVFSIPSDDVINKTFSFTYYAGLSQLQDLTCYINEYLREYFAKDNYEITDIKRICE